MASFFLAPYVFSRWPQGIDSFVRSPVGRRGFFSKRDGRWQLLMFLVGA